MAFDAFLKLDGVEGESTDAQHKGEIEVLSFSFGISQAGLGQSGGGGGAGKVELHSFSFVHKVDKSSPVLFKKACSGEHILNGMLQVREAAASPEPVLTDGTALGRGGLIFMKLSLQDILVSSVKDGGNSQTDDAPLEEVGLNYVKIEFEYLTFNADGTAGQSVIGSCPGDTKLKGRGVPAVQ